MLDEDLSDRIVDSGGKASEGSKRRRRMRNQRWIVVGWRCRIAGYKVARESISTRRMDSDEGDRDVSSLPFRVIP
jgi:hypothetical protein